MDGDQEAPAPDYRLPTWFLHAIAIDRAQGRDGVGYLERIRGFVTPEFDRAASEYLARRNVVASAPEATS